MAVPMTKINWFDNSAIQVTNDIPEIDNRPLFFVVSSFDKGPEELREISGQDFFDLYGTPLYAKHGQNGIQVQNIINNGGKVLVKRVCAEDAKLANTVCSVKLTNTEVQKVDSEGHPIYLDADGNETTEVTSNPVMENNVSIKWQASSITGCDNFDAVKKAALELLDEANGVYPLFVFCDNGRGVSSKAVRITPDYQTSRNMGTMFYNLKTYEGTSITENQVISFNPDVTYNEEAYGLTKSSCLQLNAETLSTVYDAYVAKLADLLSLDEKTVSSYDIIFGYDYKGNKIAGLSLDAESVDLNAAYGIELKQGDNGAFGAAPAGTEAWAEAIRKVFAGEETDEVWDVDEHKIAAICDANFPQNVKDAISHFVEWRKDCVFFRDLGTGLTTFSEIREAKLAQTINNRYIADYATSYTIKDPNTHKNIEVTMTYDIAGVLVSHLVNAANTPCAGIFNGFVLPSAIKGTLNFSPIITPSVNQKEAFEDMHLNYAIFNDDLCVVQSEYTTQPEYTELSYINNVLAIQEVVRAVRTSCPYNRYRLVTGTDFSDYAEACNHVLENYLGNFNVLRFKYTEDKLKSVQKIFYASIEFAFNQFAQTEVFDIYALNSANL